ncbi:PREDICTED: inositol 1,4,5-trisphosphate receptor-interacting protein-like [Ficedula albicollis]|uniref:inositol 1,4,5-trisphosphate receptor-interacting protein-like n=1 Tax=Ficedula albicollis TaxID=59894 RepID=UPI0007AD91F6|nr:PREDICTED: inositol 1,4,5-trisphosphate receptor-interacting protein-like [Ficedula albicollis]XP_016157381.1 PREDICTED: inositol 1,4,5-trisphosphate receptor-interacting protein-like [Ficedula albicollis]
MAAGILEMYLLLMAIVSMNQPSGKNGITPEEEKEIVQRMKEREVTLRQHQLCLEQEIAELEARQESLERPLWDLETKIPGHTCTVTCLVVPVVLMVWSHLGNGAPGEHREEEPNLGLLGKAWRGVAFLKKPFVLLRAIPVPVGFLEILY